MKLRFFVLAYLLLANCIAFAQKRDTQMYPWIKRDVNIMQFYNRQALQHFYNAWEKADSSKLSIVMLGDSHLQNGLYPKRVREHLQDTLGDGGHGLMFSFSTIPTYAEYHYVCKHTGYWKGERAIVMKPKLTLGIRGMTARTVSAASTLSWRFRKDIPPTHNVLKIFCKKSPKSFDLVVEINGKKIPVKVDTNTSTASIRVPIPVIQNNSIKLRLKKSNANQTFFEFYGMSLETDTDKGAIVHNAGVGAAQNRSISIEDLFEEQLPDLNADLVVVDFGTNDYLYYDKIDPKLEGHIRGTIQKIRTANPTCSILLTTAQDLYFKRRNVTSGIKYHNLIHKIAKDTDCAVWDWHWISGGQTTLKKWVAAGISQTDYIHLNTKGYNLKGDLFYEALEESVAFMEANADTTTRIYPKNKLKVSKYYSTPTKTYKTPTGKNVKYHAVRAGDTLSKISVLYGVSIADIRRWNNLKSNVIYVGTKILIYK